MALQAGALISTSSSAEGGWHSSGVLVVRPKLVGLCWGKPCCLCFQVRFSLFCLGVACGGMLLGFRAPSGILHLKFPFKLFIFQRRGSFPMKYFFQCLTEVTATRQKTRMRVEQRRLVQLSLSEEEVLGCSCKGRAQGTRVSCSCCSAPASRLWQPGLAQEVIFRMKWRMRGWMERGKVGRGGGLSHRVDSREESRMSSW